MVKQGSKRKEKLPRELHTSVSKENNIPRLQGVKKKKTATLYLQNIYREDEESDVSICKMVKSYGKEKSIPILATHIVRKKKQRRYCRL